MLRILDLERESFYEKLSISSSFKVNYAPPNFLAVRKRIYITYKICFLLSTFPQHMTQTEREDSTRNKFFAQLKRTAGKAVHAAAFTNMPPPSA
jgi:hypothetical protein